MMQTLMQRISKKLIKYDCGTIKDVSRVVFPTSVQYRFITSHFTWNVFVDPFLTNVTVQIDERTYPVNDEAQLRKVCLLLMTENQAILLMQLRVIEQSIELR